MICEDGNNVIFPSGHIFYKGFVNSYKGMDIINVRRKLKVYYTKSVQNMIIHFLKEKGYIKIEI